MLSSTQISVEAFVAADTDSAATSLMSVLHQSVNSPHRAFPRPIDRESSPQDVLGNLLIRTDLNLPSGSSPASSTADAAPQFSPSSDLTAPHNSVSLRSCTSSGSKPNFRYREYPAGDASSHAVFFSLSASSQPHLSKADPAPSRCRVGVAARIPRSAMPVR